MNDHFQGIGKSVSTVVDCPDPDTGVRIAGAPCASAGKQAAAIEIHSAIAVWIARCRPDDKSLQKWN